MSRRGFGALVAALIGLSLAIVPGTVASPAAAAPGDSDAVQRFGSCLAAGGHGDLLLVLDTSGSLQDTDPNNQRVAAANHLLDVVVLRYVDLHE